ncbi:MAG: hypothetical protein JWN72_1203, partial [Thermoleophilia bacterium]|nr:hypothetical protein [Thermoleophilia bacterium]
MASQTTELTSAASLAGTLWTDRERDACGMGFVARRDARYTREVVQLALDAVEHLAHRGAVDAGADDGSEPTGDGAGIMTAIPWSLFAGVAPDVEARGARGDLGVGMCFLARERAQRVEAMRTIEETAHALGVEVVGWRDVPTDDDALGAAARATRPYVMQVLFGRPDHVELESFEALLYRVRREIDREVRDIPGRVYVNSLSSRRIVYKGLLVARQLRRYYPDLDRDDFTSPYAVFHQRYSTNTFPTWERAQPCRMLAHNGEINTLRGNVSWMRARGEHLGWPAGRTGPDDDGSWLVPVIDERGSDSAMLDDVTQLLVHAGRELPEALTVLVPPAWDHDQDIEPHVRDLLRKNSATSEPWDGPAAIAFADGRQVGTCLDRNGLRPARWIETTDGLVACASEYGAVRVDDARVLRSGRLGPGQMLVVDLRDGSMRTGDDVVHELAAREPWGIVVAAQQLHVPDATLAGPTPLDADRATRPIAGDQALFGYSREELTAVLRPMVTSGVPPVGSMGDDTPLSALATEHRSLFGFVRQAFAEVTNPPIDPLRERLSMSLDTLVGPRPRLLQPDGAGWPALHLRSPLVTSAGLWRLRDLAQRSGMTVTDITTVLPGPTPDATDIAHAIETVCADALAAVAAGADVLVLSDRDATPDAPPLPALLVASGVHQALVRERVRARVGLVIDSGEPREPHHVAALVGHGADVVCPWLA